MYGFLTHFSLQAALKVAAETYGGKGEEVQALRMEAEVLRTCMFIVSVALSIFFSFVTNNAYFKF